MYVEIGKGTISAKAAAHRLYGKPEKLDEEALLRHYREEESTAAAKRTANEWGVIVSGVDRAQIKLASCCSPVLGDDIVGYVSKGHGIVVHRLECHNVRSAKKERFIEVIWDMDFSKKPFESLVYILSFDRKILSRNLLIL